MPENPEKSQKDGLRKTISRSLGFLTTLDQREGYQVNRIELLPWERLSYHRHTRRSEYWIVIEGGGKVTLNLKNFVVLTGDTVKIPPGTAHRIENLGHENLVLIEVQRGSYLGDDDIEYLEEGLDFER